MAPKGRRSRPRSQAKPKAPVRRSLPIEPEQYARLADRVARLEHESRIQVMRMAQIQQQLDRLSAEAPTDLGPGDRPIKRQRPS